MTQPIKLAAKIAKVMEAVGYVAKTGTNSAQGYKFVSRAINEIENFAGLTYQEQMNQMVQYARERTPSRLPATPPDTGL